MLILRQILNITILISEVLYKIKFMVGSGSNIDKVRLDRQYYLWRKIIVAERNAIILKIYVIIHQHLLHFVVLIASYKS